MTQSYTSRLLMIAAVLVVALVGFPGCDNAGGIFTFTKLFDRSIPFSQQLNLKPGIDIAGGIKLLYEIKVPADEAKISYAGGMTLAERTAAALKRRIDPNSVKNFVWRPQGNTRLEIQVPRSAQSERAGAVRDAYAKAEHDLESTDVQTAEVLRAVEKLAGPARQARLQQLAAGSPQRTQLLADLVKWFDAHENAVRKYNDAHAAHDQPDADKYADAAAQAQITYARLKDQIEDTNLTVQDLASILDIDKDSDRDARIAELKTRFAGFDRRLQAIDAFAAAYKDFKGLKGALDDVASVKALLKGSGVLEFHILVDNPATETPALLARMQPGGRGPSPQAGDEARWYELDRQRDLPGHAVKWNGKEYALAWTTPDKSLTHKPGAEWSLEQAYQTSDQNGARVVGFDFNPAGGKYFGELTGNNIGKPMAIILDDKIISAPNIKSQISDRGIIEGGPKGYTPAELDYLVGTLNAGSLPAQLSDVPISEQVITPSLGADNLRAGLIASAIGLVVVATFLISYYYLAGVVATIAVLMNIIIILGTLSMFGATFTLPSIAGIVLTVGTAVDANVLIFERLREEQHRGLSLKLALRNAYDRAWTAIVDSNMTTAITSLLLFTLGSEEVKGFGLTLLIGIISSMFTALFVTRTIFGVLIDRWGVNHLGSLPLTYPKWDNFLKPNIDWMKYIWPFIAFSAVFIITGLSAFVVKQRDMYDIEFTSGTSVQFELKTDARGKGVPLTEVVRMIDDENKRSGALPSAGVVAINNTDTVYEIVTPNHNSAQVRDAVIGAFGSRLKLELPSRFDGSDGTVEQAMQGALPTASSAASAVAPATQPATAMAQKPAVLFPIDNDALTIDGADAPDAAANVGGAAIVLRNLDPPLSPSEIKTRVTRAMLQTGRPSSGLRVDVDRLDNYSADDRDTKPAASAVVLVSDPAFPYAKAPDEWRENLARPAWKMIGEGVNREAPLQKVNNFDPQVAGDTRRDAITATFFSILIIMLYIWVRFGNLKYGTATIVALIHDTLITIGAIGLSHYATGHAIGNFLLVEPFRINLTLVAAILTVMSYSMIDTIVVFDRIRENRGRFGHVSRQVINDSINQVLSRTLLTAGTTIVMVAVMYIMGGPGVHGFTFVLLVGILVGTYSSIAIAAPILLVGARKTLPAGKSRPQVEPGPTRGMLKA